MTGFWRQDMYVNADRIQLFFELLSDPQVCGLAIGSEL